MLSVIQSQLPVAYCFFLRTMQNKVVMISFLFVNNSRPSERGESTLFDGKFNLHSVILLSSLYFDLGRALRNRWSSQILLYFHSSHAVLVPAKTSVIARRGIDRHRFTRIWTYDNGHFLRCNAGQKNK